MLSKAESMSKQKKTQEKPENILFLTGLINPDYSLITSLEKNETWKRESQCYIMVLILIPPYECYVTARVGDEVKEERQKEGEERLFMSSDDTHRLQKWYNPPSKKVDN